MWELLSVVRHRSSFQRNQAAHELEGIALYTWHKYKKALDSTIPLDSHGNPIEEEEALVGDGQLELDETEPLAVRMSMHHERERVRYFTQKALHHLLTFVVG